MGKPKSKYAKKSVRKKKVASGAARAKTPAELGRARITAGDYEGAIKTLSAAIAKHPRESINYRLRGNAFDNLGRRDEAVADWKRAASLGDTIIQSYLVFLGVEWP